MSHDDEYMRIAIGEAQKAYACGERIAFGALIVRDDKIIAQAHNSVKDLYDPTAHAEIIAIRGAAQKLKTSDLEECVLYSTCEPCPMCFSAAWWARIPTLVFGTALRDAQSGGQREIAVPCSYLNDKSGNLMEIRTGVLAAECLELLKRR
ncbi:MAG TPA: nucleoside deaminase [Candidatus Nanoarchaeia archaeon]|nr:nucleoside deaminase [Candidatus Nanoarchaeia archaeon]